jgi:hypothetical protein
MSSGHAVTEYELDASGLKIARNHEIMIFCEKKNKKQPLPVWCDDPPEGGSVDLHVYRISC